MLKGHSSLSPSTRGAFGTDPSPFLRDLIPLWDRKLFLVTEFQTPPPGHSPPCSLECTGESLACQEPACRVPGQQLGMERQEAGTMDERSSVPRWVGEGQAGSLVYGSWSSAG